MSIFGLPPSITLTLAIVCIEFVCFCCYEINHVQVPEELLEDAKTLAKVALEEMDA